MMPMIAAVVNPIVAATEISIESLLVPQYSEKGRSGHCFELFRAGQQHPGLRGYFLTLSVNAFSWDQPPREGVNATV